MSGKPHVLSRENALERFEDTGITQGRQSPADGETLSDGAQNEDEVVPPVKKALSLDAGGQVTPQIHFNFQIQIPENGSPEDYDAIFKSIGTYLLGRKDD